MGYTKENQLRADERLAIRTRIFAPILRAGYAKALKVAEFFWQKYPYDFSICYLYSALQGDYAEFCPPKETKALKKRFIAMMRELLHGSRAESDPVVLNGIKNEYYWQTKNRLAQYKLGLARAAAGEAKVYYCQGVGVAWHAYELAMCRQRAKAPAGQFVKTSWPISCLIEQYRWPKRDHSQSCRPADGAVGRSMPLCYDQAK